MVEPRIGTSDGVDAHLLAERFNRHTFWCGQSGSGKTYALGVVLEQLLIHTRLPILVMDPNADFVGIGETVDDADPAQAAALHEQSTRVLHSANPDGQQLRIRYVDLDLRTKAAVLRLDPVADPEEYNVLLQFEQELGAVQDADLLATLRASDDPARRHLALRIENLGVLEWDLWAFDAETAKDVYAERPRALVMDLSGFDHPDEPRTAALAVLDHLWAHRAERKPVLLVIDEAHNLCPPDPTTPLERALTERIIQIAAEGRKYGLWLLLGLMVAKMIATGLTIGIGGSGGVFAPSLFVGGMLGAAFGIVAQQTVPGISGPAGAFALVGMGAVFAGAARAPITAVLILFELTGEYTIILPLMLAIVLATTVSRALSKDSAYTLKLRRRGLEIDTRPADPRLSDRSVGDVMEPPADAVDPSLPLTEATRLLLAGGRPTLPVLYGGLLIGQLRADRVAQLLEEDGASTGTLTVADAVDDVPTVLTTESLRSGLDALRGHPHADGGLAVADPQGRLVGWVTHRTLLRTLTAPVPDPDPVDLQSGLRAGLGSVRGVMGRGVMGRGAGSRGDRVTRRARGKGPQASG